MDGIRTAAEVACRALAVFSVVGLALGAERTTVLEWLSENDLWSTISPLEAGFIDTPTPSRQQLVDASWLSERLIVLIWALGLVDLLTPADEQCDTAVFQRNLPPFAPVSAQDFIANARLRPDTELIVLAEEILRLHWEARDARQNNRATLMPVEMEIIQERHHALNWIIGYDGLPWDEVTTDT